MSVGIFDKPFSATSNRNGHELLVIALLGDGRAVCINDEGHINALSLSDINISLRYDDRRHVWVDAILPPEEDTDEED